MPNESNKDNANKDTKAKPALTTIEKPKESYVSTSTTYVTRVNKQQSSGAGRHVGGFGGSTPGGRGA